ncbi:MAG: VWA domain-containing protein [Myxococcales bacterium]|nr:VWA domain-containing protein [Myxococcales bacterium]
MKRATVLALAAMFSAAAVACGSSQTDFDPGAYGAGGGPTAAGGNKADAGIFANPQATPPSIQACRTGQDVAKQLPLHIVLMLDRSGSMCEFNPNNTSDRNCQNPASKWQQVRGALAAFFQSPASAGITITTVQFPAQAGGGSNNCNANLYKQTYSQLAPLPDPGQLLFNIDSRASSNDGNTPTYDALTGGLSLAQQITAQLTTPARVAALMATDGIPAGCNDADNIGASAQLAAQVASTIPTYVIGVGNQLQALDQLAVAGGTKQAFIASTTNPQLVGQYVAAALNSIRQAAVGCEYQVPAAPANQTLDPTKVNVEFTGFAGKGAIGQNQGCGGNGLGWTYDNPAAPKSIKLCPTTCAQVSNDSTAKIDIVFGCATEQQKIN